MTVQIKIGGYFADAEGARVGPMLCDECDAPYAFPFYEKGRAGRWALDGTNSGRLDTIPARADLVSEWVDGVVITNTPRPGDLPGSRDRKKVEMYVLSDPLPEEHLRQMASMLGSDEETVPATIRTIYLSGPMKGYPQSNYPLFNIVAAQLRGAGHTVYNPAEFSHDGPPDEFPIRKAFSEYSRFICEWADTIVLLPAWEASTGVSAELALAKNCGLDIIEFKNLNISLA